ncbi:alpha/beta hydrolase [Mycobacterium sp. B14F4]|uniref:alpha/beta hydrolase n=1 Tax=Mycobacterium sp. B14F4 TaxID=3153565 RepID=UPI00325CC6EF
MVDRFLVWVSAGVITAGMSAAMVAGAAVAIADDASDGGGTSTSTSEPSNTGDDETGSTVGSGPNDSDPNHEDSDETTPDDPGATDPDADEEEPAEQEPAEQEPAGEEPADPAGGDTEAEDAVKDEDAAKDDADSDRTDRATTAPATPKPAVDPDRGGAIEAESGTEAVVRDNDDPTRVSPPVEQERTTVVIAEPVEDIAETPTVQAVAFASAPTAAAVNVNATAPQIPAIIRVIGTIVFNLYALATRLIGGPPILPANSGVTVRSSTLVLNCGCDDGDTVEVPADWYVPNTEEGQPPPDRLIYLQHGFLAAGPWYSHTAAALAKQTNSIVVAPSITSNFLAADACWLGAPPMHEAIAGLFADGNTALADSALAAGYAGPVPDRVVLMGHSLGGGAVIGAAGYMADNGSIDRLAGVVMLDGVPLADGAVESLAKVPDEIPIYQLAAPKYFWNQFGVGSSALQQARPGEFIGVTLVGGSHVDAMRGGNPLIQFSQQLVSGFSTRQNVAAARMLMVGWVNDMFAGTQDQGVYLDIGEKFSLDTPAGTATLVALPNSLTKWFPLNFLQPFVALSNGIFTFEPTCVTASMGAASSCQEPIAA